MWQTSPRVRVAARETKSSTRRALTKSVATLEEARTPDCGRVGVKSVLISVRDVSVRDSQFAKSQFAMPKCACQNRSRCRPSAIRVANQNVVALRLDGDTTTVRAISEHVNNYIGYLGAIVLSADLLSFARLACPGGATTETFDVEYTSDAMTLAQTCLAADRGRKMLLRAYLDSVAEYVTPRRVIPIQECPRYHAALFALLPFAGVNRSLTPQFYAWPVNVHSANERRAANLRETPIKIYQPLADEEASVPAIVEALVGLTHTFVFKNHRMIKAKLVIADKLAEADTDDEEHTAAKGTVDLQRAGKKEKPLCNLCKNGSTRRNSVLW